MEFGPLDEHGLLFVALAILRGGIVSVAGFTLRVTGCSRPILRHELLLRCSGFLLDGDAGASGATIRLTEIFVNISLKRG